jgi:hypothetical protein
MTTAERQRDLFEGVIPPDTPLGNYQCQQMPTLPPPPADPLDHHQRFGVSAEQHVRALEWLSDNNQEFADLEDRQAAFEEVGDAAGAAAVQEQLDQIVADHLRRPAPEPPASPPDATKATEATEAPEPPLPAQPESAQSPVCLKWNQLAPGRRALVPELEKHLREKGWPYVAVDDAKQAVFANSVSIKAFDYLIYSSIGPNLLVLVITRRPTAEQAEQMQEWQKVFGADFQAVFMFSSGGEWRLVLLQDLQTPDPLAHARSLEDSVN